MSDAGKYRWMTPEEFVAERMDQQWVWVAYNSGQKRTIAQRWRTARRRCNRALHDNPHRREIVLKQLRICRALVPEVPTESTP